MPSINNIDKFTQTLNSLGDEPEILQSRGEVLQKVEVPQDDVLVNPFLVNIEDNGEEAEIEELPDLADDLDLFDDEDTFSSQDAPILEEDDSFNLDEFGSSVDGIESLESLDDIVGLEDEESLEPLSDIEEIGEEGSLESLGDIEELGDEGSLESLGDIEELGEEVSLDTLGDIEELDVEDSLESLGDIEGLGDEDSLESLGDIEGLGDEDSLESLGNIEELGDEDSLESLGDIEELGDEDFLESPGIMEDDFELDFDSDTESSDQPENPLDDDIEALDLSDESDDSMGILEEFEEISDIDDITPGEDLEEISDLDLDTTESLDNELGIQDIALDDIGGDETLDELQEEEIGDELSIEDEVLQDDFGSFDDDDDSDEFSLVDFGDTFNLDEDDSSGLLKLDEFNEAAEETEEPQEEVKYTQDEFNNIQVTLMGLPLNVRIVIEEEIAENGLFGVKLEGLVSLLIDKASLRDIVKYLNKSLGHKIKISSAYEKITAEALEARKRKFIYIFLNRVIPKLKWVAPISIGAALLFLAGYFWGYKIYKSEEIYKRGHELILVDKYEEAYDEFILAFNTHRKMKWYYTYADTYLDRKAYNFAEIIYLQILNEDSSENRAVLSYSKMLGLEQGEYEKASNFLLSYIDSGRREYQFYTTLGDIYMKWAEIDPAKYEDARLWYNEARHKYGNFPPILFKILDYLVATDKLEEVKFQRRVFEKSTDVEVDGDTYARMAGYLIDKGVVETIRDTIFRGLRDNPRNPNLHYQLARYYASIGDTLEGEKALRKAIFYYTYGGDLTKEELASLVDARRLLGELYLKEERYLSAEDNFQDSVSLYESLKERNLIDAEEKYGGIYSGYGDIFYYGGNSLNTAYNLYSKAEENEFSSKELSYKKGFIKYSMKETKAALEEFHKSEDRRDLEVAVILSKANTLSLRGSYSSSLTYYDILLDHLERLEEEIGTLYPRENDQHLSIIENYIRIYNNRAVTLYKLNGEKALPEVGLNFTRSTEYYDYLTRDPDFLVRSESKDLAYYNSRALLFPHKDMELLLYMNISKDFEDLNLGVVSKVNYGEGSEE